LRSSQTCSITSSARSRIDCGAGRPLFGALRSFTVERGVANDPLWTFIALRAVVLTHSAIVGFETTYL
jgi:hypothetical protein